MTPLLVGIAAIVAMVLSLILRLLQGSIHGGVFLTWQTFLIIGLLCWVAWDVLRGPRSVA